MKAKINRRKLSSLLAAAVMVASFIGFGPTFVGTASALPTACNQHYEAVSFGARYQWSYAPNGFCLNSDYSNPVAYTVFQGDGNLVTYRNGRAVWASNTAGQNATRLVFQSDSNVVIYRVNVPLWNTHTNGKGGNIDTQMAQFENGELNIYANNYNQPLRQIW